MFLLVMSSVPNLITHNPASAQTVHRCKEVQKISGDTVYRVEPNIPGSREMKNPTIVWIKCLVPVTDRKCFYRELSEKKWHRCGESPSQFAPFNNGYGLVLEDDDGRRYYGFSHYNYEFYFD